MKDNRLLEADYMLRYGVGSDLEYETYKPVFSNKAGNSVGTKEVIPLAFSLGKFTDEGNHVSKRSSHPSSSQVSIWSKKSREMQGERGRKNSQERKKRVLWKRALRISHFFLHSPQSFLLAIQIILNFILRIISIQPVQLSCSVMSDSWQPHEPQHMRLPCPSPTPGVHPTPCPLSQWCHPTISSSVIPFSSCPQPLPASGSFPLSQLFASDG